MDIQFDRYSLVLNGRREVIRSGALHYFRLPHQQLWWDRLQKLKMAGYNTIDLYFSWDFHSKAPGQYDFTGCRDIKRLLEMVRELGLYLIARPGPYINAETTRGGLPGWLLREPDVILRNREDGAYRYSERYMDFVAEWFAHILPFLKGQNNMLMIQVENEYSTLDMEPDYMEALIRLIRSHGITVPTMHNDFYAAGLYADVVDIYAVDNYSVTAFDLNWRTFPGIFSVMDHLEFNIRPEFCPNRPLMIAELQAGWFAGWKGVPYQTIHQSLGRDHIGVTTRSFLGQGGTIFNHYKAVGGTNWDHLGATDAYTSYDFSAPINEAGIPTERLYEAKRINLLLSHFDLTQTERVAPETIGLSESPSLYTVRQDMGTPGAFWIFTRNLTQQSHSIVLTPGVRVETPPYHAAILPYHLPLKNGWRLDAISCEPLIQTERYLLLPGERPATLEVYTPKPIRWQTDANTQVQQLDTQQYRIRLQTSLAPQEISQVVLGDTPSYFLGAALVDRVWPIGNDHYWIGPDLVVSPEEAYAANPDQPCWELDAEGSLHRLEPLQCASYEVPDIHLAKAWQCVAGEFPHQSKEGFVSISGKGLDMDSNGIYEGAVWYRFLISGQAKQLTLRAQHIWAIYLNGECITEGHTFHVYPDTGGPEDAITVLLPEHLLRATEPNELLVFVESLGHHKGFYDDTRDSRGILSIAIEDKPLDWQLGWIRPANLYAPPNQVVGMQQPESVPILHATTEFVLSLPEEVLAPMGLELDLNAERVNIVLNGVLVGKYWRACKNQSIFYLPEGILRTNGLNQLTLTCYNFLPASRVENPFPKTYGTVRLVPYQQFFKLSAQPADMETKPGKEQNHVHYP